MAAGLGFKDFVTGEVLTAADVDGYLMQGVWVFASAAARDAAVTSPQEGNFAYLKDTNVTTYYTGSAWANLDTTGMTNPMTTTGDTIYSSSGSTPARLGIGSTGQVLTVAGGVPSWASPAGGGKLLQMINATTSTAVTIASTSDTDTGITATITPTSDTSKILILVNSITGFYRGTAQAYQGLKLKVLRNGSVVIGNNNQYAFRVTNSPTQETNHENLVSTSYIDSPGSTSALTYKIQSAAYTTSNSGSVTWQSGDSLGSITLLEIGA